MLIGHVSDEYYSALNDVSIEFERDDAEKIILRSSPRGAIYADLPPGNYRVTLARDGYGAKTVTATIDPSRPCQFRMLTDSMYGYAWPKWVRAGESAEYRVHSPEPYRLALWRYGRKKELTQLIGWIDE